MRALGSGDTGQHHDRRQNEECCDDDAAYPALLCPLALLLGAQRAQSLLHKSTPLMPPYLSTVSLPGMFLKPTDRSVRLFLPGYRWLTVFALPILRGFRSKHAPETASVCITRRPAAHCTACASGRVVLMYNTALSLREQRCLCCFQIFSGSGQRSGIIQRESWKPGTMNECKSAEEVEFSLCDVCPFCSTSGIYICHDVEWRQNTRDCTWPRNKVQPIWTIPHVYRVCPGPQFV